MLKFIENETGRVFHLYNDKKKVGAAWFSLAENAWCWCLHGEEFPIDQGYGEDASGACTDLVGSYWKNVDSSVRFPD